MRRFSTYHGSQFAILLICGLTAACTGGDPSDEPGEPVDPAVAEAISALSNGTYTLAPGNATGMRLDVTGEATANGTKLEIWTPNTGNNQRFIFTAQSNGSFRISPAHAPSTSLDVKGASTASGSQVQIF